MSVINNGLLLGAGADGYQISRSVRLRQSASAYLNRTLTTPTNNKIWTWSGWVKRGKLGSAQAIIGTTDNNTASGNYGALRFNASDYLEYFEYASAYTLQISSNGVYRDPSAWYHIVVAIDTTQATAANRTKFYVNGVAVAMSLTTSPALNYNTFINSAVATYQGAYNNSGTGVLALFDGYMTEINFIDGQALTPSSFGQTNSVTGVWQPIKYAGTYGTNGFYLNFSDNSAATATTIGKDYSGNGNNWTPNNISVTAGVTYDSFLDVPTPYADGGTGRGNYSVGNPLAVNLTTNSSATLTNGNLYINNGSANYSGFSSTIGIPTSGKWAWKFKVTGSVGASNDGTIGFACNSAGNPVTGASNAAAANWYTTVQIQYISGRGVVHNYANAGVVTDLAQTTGATNDEYEFLIDRDAGTTIVKCNGTTLVTVTGLPATQVLFPYGSFYQTGGYFIFDYTPSDTTYKTLNTQNLPTPTISNGANYMNASLWTGDASTPRAVVSNLAFSPDLVWTKDRSVGYQHSLQDTVRGTGASKKLYSSLTEAENGANSVYGHINSFDANGFTVATGSSGAQHVNASGVTYVGWSWKAGGTAVSNTSGSITSTVSAGATQGFSVVTWTGSGAAATVGHGLGVAPKMVIIKNRTTAASWPVYHASIGNTAAVFLNATNASTTSSTYFNNTSPTSSVFSVESATATNGSTNSMVAYCFSEVAGYSKFGSYTGNGSADGPFVFLGFRPRFIMIKRTDAVARWYIYDTSRNTYNTMNNWLAPNLSDAENTATAWEFDFLSNGFKVRNNGAFSNASGGTYIFMAVAENPFKLSLAR